MSEPPPPNPFDPPKPPAYGPPQPPAYGPPQPPAYGQPSFAPPKTSNGLAIAALVVALVGLLGCWFPFLGVVLPVIAIGLAIAGLVRSGKISSGKGMSISALIIGAVTLVVAIGISVYVLRFVDCFKPGMTQEQQQTCTEDKIRG